VKPAMQQVVAALDPLLARLQAAFSRTAAEAPAPAPAPASATPAQSREAAAQLTKLLSEFDPGAADFIEANGSALRPLFTSEAWTPFAELVRDYVFAEAQAQLEQALKNFGG